MNKFTSATDARRSVAKSLIRLFDDAGDTARLSLARMIEVRLREPQAFVTVVGETGSGKSTLVNALLAKPLLPVSAVPSTGAVTHVILHKEPETHFFAIYEDASQEEITPAQFMNLSLEPCEDLLRLQVRIPTSVERYAGLQVFDTPGYNSLLSQHEEILRGFLPESDVVVFVVGYRAGFGQVNQDLLEVVGSSISSDVSIPVIIAINRVPPDCRPKDRRVLEIMDHASDCLKREPHCILVESAPCSDSDEDAPSVPNADALWSAVTDFVTQPNYQDAVLEKLDWLLKNLIKDALEEREREEYELAANDTDRELILTQIALLREARDRSRKAVRQTINHLQSKLPDIVRRGCKELINELASEIDTADKWSDSKGCAEWLSIHKLPYGVRDLAKRAVSEILADLQRLNKDLSEIANTAVQKVQADVRIKSDAADRFTENLARTIAERVGGVAMTNLLRSFGGACGQAAGAGNLVKMVISKSGKIVQTTFSREVYNTIGRTFTKKFLARLNVAAMVIIEVGGFLIEVARWQGKLKTKVTTAVDGWREDTIDDLLSKQLPDIERRNLESVGEIYDDLIASENTSARTNRQSLDGRLIAIRAQMDTLRALAENLLHQYN